MMVRVFYLERAVNQGWPDGWEKAGEIIPRGPGIPIGIWRLVIPSDAREVK